MNKKIMVVLMCLSTIILLTSCSNDFNNVPKDKVTISNEKQDIKNNTYFGSWKISKVAGYSPIYVDTDESANIGKKASYSAQLARLDDTEIKNPIYTEKKYSKSKFFEEYRTHLSDIGIDDEEIRIIEIEDWSGPGGGLIIKNEQALILLWNGIYYELNKE
ncbi:hypothetical protein [Paenibacillus agilis]|uniref:Lipocalin-like domain-containing protein n=1 Tax=Paenibacillus agilis TaxID=3020863 RepID=A0A559J1P0_9BACL|nr:hypothetical protein [Paenibacillus agilis]TVX93804.1 hypothetical protein FPZ44_12515 [Paenibacillus agilis]